MATNKDGEHISQSLSEVLNDIGVNEGEVLKKRRTQQLCESMETISWKVTGRNSTFYHLGSQSEGTTTVGLQSDIDTLGCNHDVNVMQDWSEWEPGKVNYLMIQDENTTPGYCFLQKPISEETHSMTSTHMPDLKLSTDRKGRILLKNTNINVPDFENHGPAFVRQGHHASKDKDMVLALPCKSWPQSASSWIERQDIGGKWPTKEMRRYAASTECFVVATGSKISLYPELEWRISTCLAERCLMFDLNITQIRCYVLMKMIFKCFKNTKGEVNISSYMCKAVLFHCIKDTEPCIWKEGNLFTCLTYCLQELNSCVQNDHCSHFIISENNLMAGQFTSETKHELSKLISDIIESDGHWLCRIDIDDFGRRLQVKLNLAPKKAYRFQSSLERRALASASNYFNLAYQIGINHIHILLGNPNTDIRVLKQSVEKLDTIRGNVDNRLEHAASNFLAPFLFATYGSALTSSSISENNQVSTDALDWLTAGLNSDMSSSRLKLASVLYRTGDMEKAEQLLRHVEKQFYSNPAVPICICCERHQRIQPLDLLRVCAEQSDECVTRITAFCVRFLVQESNCVPHELQYEMFRSTQDDMTNRNQDKDYWMDWAAVDSLPYLYFLQYKIYNRLRRQEEQQQALNNLCKTIEKDENLGHKETALNLLGQCQEQEEKWADALKCYINSLQVRAKNNAACVHICKLLSRLLNQKTV